MKMKIGYVIFNTMNKARQPASRLNRMNGLNMKIKIKFYAINVLVKNKTKSIVIIVNAQLNKIKLDRQKKTTKTKQKQIICMQQFNKRLFFMLTIIFVLNALRSLYCWAFSCNCVESNKNKRPKYVACCLFGCSLNESSHVSVKCLL